MIVKTGGGMILKNPALNWGHVSDKSQPAQSVASRGDSEFKVRVVLMGSGLYSRDECLDAFTRRCDPSRDNGGVKCARDLSGPESE